MLNKHSTSLIKIGILLILLNNTAYAKSLPFKLPILSDILSIVLDTDKEENNQQPVMADQTSPILTDDDGGEVDIPNMPNIPEQHNQAIANQNPDNQWQNTNSPHIQSALQVPLGAVSPTTVAKFVKMTDIVREQYFQPIDDEILFDNAMTGMVTKLDPYSEYLDKQSFDNLKLFTDGDIGTIGVSVSYHYDQKAWVFDEVLPNSPASLAGIQRHNFLHQINDTKLDNDQTQQDIDQLLSGIAGTQVRLVISDKGRRKHQITVQRSLLQQQNINAKVVQGIAIVHIPIFQNNTRQQFLNALGELNQPFSAIIIDIRNNPGGVLSSANDIASLFMKNKNVAQVINRQGLQEVIKTHGEPILADIPLAILQNRYSASASEVLAVSLQENKRANIFGETSYGKGSIQSVVPLNDDEAIKLTVAYYLSGSGKKIDGVGVVVNQPLTASEVNWEQQMIDKVLTYPRPTSYRLTSGATLQQF